MWVTNNIEAYRSGFLPSLFVNRICCGSSFLVLPSNSLTLRAEHWLDYRFLVQLLFVRMWCHSRRGFTLLHLTLNHSQASSKAILPLPWVASWWSDMLRIAGIIFSHCHRLPFYCYWVHEENSGFLWPLRISANATSPYILFYDEHKDSSGIFYCNNLIFSVFTEQLFWLVLKINVHANIDIQGIPKESFFKVVVEKQRRLLLKKNYLLWWQEKSSGARTGKVMGGQLVLREVKRGHVRLSEYHERLRCQAVHGCRSGLRGG